MTHQENDSIALREGDSDYYLLDSLANWRENFNQGDSGGISLGIKKFGYNRSIAIWKSSESESSNFIVMAGNHTLIALKMLHNAWLTAKRRGNDNTDNLIPKGNIVVDNDEWFILCNNCSHLSYDEAKAYAISDNRWAQVATQDNDMLLKYLMEIEESDDPELMEAVGYDDDDIQFLLDAIGEDGEPNDSGQGEDKPPNESEANKLLAKWEVKEGDLWIIPSKSGNGEHRLLCGDTTKSDDIQKLMDGVLAHLLITDPPYGVSYADKNKFLNSISKGNRIQEPIENDHMSVSDMSELWLVSFTNAIEATNGKASYYIFSPQGGGLMMMMMMIEKAGWQLKHSLIWVKNNHVLGRSDYSYKHEPILFGWKQKGTHLFHGGFQTSVLEFNKPQKNDLHPTMKPIELLAFLIENSSQVGELIFDPFAGSGSTGIAAESLSRVSRMIEITPKYCSVILQRMENYGLEPFLYVGE